MVSTPSWTDIRNAGLAAGGAMVNAGKTVAGDAKAAGSNLYDLHVNDNAPQTINWEKRHTLELLGAAAVGGAVDYGEDGDFDSYDAAAGVTGAAWHEVAKRTPHVQYQIRSPIVWGGKEAENNNHSTPAPGQGNGPGTETTEQPTSTSQTETTTTSTTQHTTTATPDLEYDSISQGLLEESDQTQQGFKGYSLTALSSQLDGVSIQEAVENTSDYEASIRDALEGTQYFEDEGIFRLGEYGVTSEDPNGKGVDLVDQIGSSHKFDTYMDNLEQRGELEDQMFGYVESLERV